MAETKAYYDPRTLETAVRPDVGNLQQALLSLEDALDQAHGLIDLIEGAPPVEGKGASEPDGAVATVERCLNRLSRLNDRLRTVSEKVGRL